MRQLERAEPHTLSELTDELARTKVPAVWRLGATPAQITAREAAMAQMRRLDITMNGVFTLRIPAKG